MYPQLMLYACTVWYSNSTTNTLKGGSSGITHDLPTLVGNLVLATINCTLHTALTAHEALYWQQPHWHHMVAQSAQPTPGGMSRETGDEDFIGLLILCFRQMCLNILKVVFSRKWGPWTCENCKH